MARWGSRLDRPLVLYQGGFSVDRGIEELVAALDEPALAGSDVTVAFIGYGRLRAWLTGRLPPAPGGSPSSTRSRRASSRSGRSTPTSATSASRRGR